jgi:protein-tyrosine phosphatase
MDFINFPIKDRAVPTDKVAVENLIKLLDNKVCNGEKIVIHCRMGIGRSSLIAGAVLIAKGLDPDKVIEKITIIRELKVPDTEEQILWLRKLKKDLQ